MSEGEQDITRASIVGMPCAIGQNVGGGKDITRASIVGMPCAETKCRRGKKI